MKSLVIFALWLLFSMVGADGVEIVPGRLKVSADSSNYIPYICNYPLETPNRRIKHVILAIHSSNHDARMVYNSVTAVLDRYKLDDSVLIIAPQFLVRENVSGISYTNMVYWEVSPFWGSSVAKVTPGGEDFRISAYTILEGIISALCKKKVFANLESIVILGHSAGGQLVNRFAASNTVEDEAARLAGIGIKYVVMNPSSYVYFSRKRSVGGSRVRFAVPDEKIIAENPEYNNYGYGLDRLYAFHRHKKLDADKIRQQYRRRNVIYMLGREDVKADASLSKHPSAMLQGKNRLQRGTIYYGHLVDEFGEQIKERQKLVYIRGVGHVGRKMMLSPMGAKHIIGGFMDGRVSHAEEGQ